MTSRKENNYILGYKESSATFCYLCPKVQQSLLTKQQEL